MGPGLIPGWGTKIPPATWYGQKKREKEATFLLSLDDWRNVETVVSEIKKSHPFEVLSSLILCNEFPDWIVRAMKSGFYMAISDDHLSSWSEKKLQSTF